MPKPARVHARFDTRGLIAWRSEGRVDLRMEAAPNLQTRFRWYSVSKLVTATVALRLVEAGALNLDAPLPGALGASLRALLSHASGMPNPSALRWVQPLGAPLRTPSELTRELLRSARRAGPAPRYSNLNYLLIAEHIEEATGRPFRAHVTDLTEALRMTETHFDPVPAAVGHESVFPRGAAMTALFFPRSLSMIDYVRGRWVGLCPMALEGEAYGGLIGSLADLVRFGRMHLGDGAVDGVRVLERETARAMREPVNPAFGLGFEQQADGWVGHAGQAGGYRASLRLHPERGLGEATLAAWGDAPV
ncbi:MAG: serine hydrolase domain-containing protein [Sandaracinaceae bacterium]